ncbi:MAG: Nine-heme cytochrome C [Desulfovibrio sp.]|nr:Nine-heme cytochrome C [Desulfovibrio sp.]
MRNGKALLKQTAMAAACTFCLIIWGAGPGQASELEATDSGAPSAKVMFPVSAKATAPVASMKPVLFNHLIHEKAVEKCETCHHTGDPASCSDCHSAEGKEEGKFITLEKAMHAKNIAVREDGKTPSSCVSCHEQQTAKRECAGCHSTITPSYDAAWCSTCHNVNVTPQQMADGSNGRLSEAANLAVATKTVQETKRAAAPATLGPAKAVIDAIANEYEPCVFNHKRHMASLMENIKDSKLAAAFHTQPETLCATCHHHSPLSLTPPKCVSCHPVSIDRMQPARPQLKAAYHLQCMGCHKGMDVKRPVNTSCTSCHKAKAPAAAEAPAEAAEK